MGVVSLPLLDASILTQEESLELLLNENISPITQKKMKRVSSVLVSSTSRFCLENLEECPQKMFAGIPSLKVEKVFRFPLDWIVFRAAGLNYEIWRKYWGRYVNESSRIPFLSSKSRHAMLREAYQAALQAEGMIPLPRSTRIVLLDTIKIFLNQSSRCLKLPSINDVRLRSRFSLKEIMASFKLFSYARMLCLRFSVNVFKMGGRIVIGSIRSLTGELKDFFLENNVSFGNPCVAAPLGRHQSLGAWVIPPSKLSAIPFAGKYSPSTGDELIRDDDGHQWLDLVESITSWINPSLFVFPDTILKDQDHDFDGWYCQGDTVGSECSKASLPKIVNDTVYCWEMRNDDFQEDIQRTVKNSMELRKLLHRAQHQILDHRYLQKNEEHRDTLIELLKPIVDVKLIEPRFNVVFLVEHVSLRDFWRLVYHFKELSVFPIGHVFRTRNNRVLIITSVYHRHCHLTREWLQHFRTEFPQVTMRMNKTVLKPFRNSFFTLKFFNYLD